MSAFDVLLIVAGVGYLLIRRLIGELVEIKGLLVVPAVLTVIGITQLRHLAPRDVTTVAFVVIGCLLSIALGVARGRTVHLGARDGALWMRYRPVSVGLWVLNIALKGALIPLERGVSSASASAADHTIVLSIGLGILAETAVVVLRAMRTDATVVWEKGEDGAPHHTSPAFEQARTWVNGPGAGRSAGQVAVDVKRFAWPEREW